jgi:hypothetical protein
MSKNKQPRPKNYKQATHSQIITLTSLMQSQETIKMMESCAKHDYRSFESNFSTHTHTHNSTFWKKIRQNMSLWLNKMVFKLLAQHFCTSKPNTCCWLARCLDWSRWVAIISLLPFVVSVLLWVRLGKSKITNLGCEKKYCLLGHILSTGGDAWRAITSPFHYY